MAPKKKEHSTDLRALVVQQYQSGDSQREIAKKTLLPRETVRYMIKKYKETKIHRKFIRTRSKKKDHDNVRQIDYSQDQV